MVDYKKSIEEIIQNYYPVSTNSIGLLSDHIEVISIPKSTLFVKKDAYNDYDYFLLSGICRSFITNQEGQDISISFFQNQTVLTPNVARTYKEQSTLNFEALTDIVIGRFKAIELVLLMRKVTELRSFANAVLQQELILKANKELNNASLAARDRLIKFRNQYDALENFIPHSMIASYLGITNISLSRIRRELANEQH